MHNEFSDRRVVRSEAMLPPQGSYSAALVAGSMFFTAGTGAFDPRSGDLVGETIEQQTAQVLNNLEASLAAAGLRWEHVVKVAAHLSHLHRDFAGYDLVYRSRLPEPWPVRTTVGADLLLGMLIEVDLIATTGDVPVRRD